MMKRSAGILPYRFKDGVLSVYLEHPGGPYWEGKDLWSICKGEYTYEKAIDAAVREFEEETGFKVEKDNLFFVGSLKQQATNKLVTVFGIQCDLDPSKMKSNTFKLEWPPMSGNICEFPEMDEGRWFQLEEAKEKIFKGQIKILEKMESIINSAK